MSDLYIERAWAIWPTEDPQNDQHPCAILTPEEWRELTSLPVRFSDPEELAAD